MTSNLALKVGRKLFEKNIRHYEPVDPLYETYIGSDGKEKRRRRELPAGLSARDAKILKAVQKRAHHLDKGFSICGLRFGWTFIVGIIPGAGDALGAVLNYYLVVRKARQAEIPGWLLRKMLFNNAISAAVGFIPIAGDLVLAAFKANSRNAAIFEEFLRIRGEEFLKKESERIQDPANVKPGAGKGVNEKVPGKDDRNNGWFRKKSKGNKGKERAVGEPRGETLRRDSRFIEDIPLETAEVPRKK